MSQLKIAVTGTKGKTTVVNFLADVAQRSKKFDKVLLVNTTGHFINGKRRSTLADSSRVYGLVPSVAPGRYLYELDDPQKKKNQLAVLEASLGCSALSGLAYAFHDVGIFLNVYEDHLGSSDRLKSKQDIFEAKIFIVTKIKKGGFAILNADDPLVFSAQDRISEKKDISIIFFGLQPYDEKRTPVYVTIEDHVLVYYVHGKRRRLFSCNDVSWTFQGRFTPSLYNLLAITGGLIGLNKGVVPLYLKELLHTNMPEDGGRLTLLQAKSGTQIIADYAHEKYSLAEVAKLARLYTGPGGRVIGVLRLAYDRTDDLIKDTAKHIAASYDHFVIYDKIDGYWKKAKAIQSTKFTQENGKISKIFSTSLMEYTSNVERIVREDQALDRVAKIVKPEDVVVFIVNDDIKRSIAFVKKTFNAKVHK